MRISNNQPDNSRFINWLDDLCYNPVYYGRIQAPAEARIIFTLSDLCDHTYPADLLTRACNDHEAFADRAILSARNGAVADINAYIIQNMPGEGRTYLATHEIQESDQESAPPFPPEFLASLDFPSIPPSRLRLKVGCPVILLRNLFPERGLCNGTRLVIVSLGRAIVQARILTGDFKGQTTHIPKIKLFSSIADFPYIIGRFQFPFRLCFAITINKSQGQSLNHIAVDLRAPVFTHGQFYVAMSRVTNVHNLSILLSSAEDLTCTNIVFPEVLLREDESRL